MALSVHWSQFNPACSVIMEAAHAASRGPTVKALQLAVLGMQP
jgi:hypothetical protein